MNTHVCVVWKADEIEWYGLTHPITTRTNLSTRPMQIKALTDYYATVLPSNCEILDICSSWISHYPAGIKFKRAVGLGMNEFELKKNKQLDDYVVKVGKERGV